MSLNKIGKPKHDFIVYFYRNTDSALITALTKRGEAWLQVQEGNDPTIVFVDLDEKDGERYLKKINKDRYRPQVYYND